MLEHRPAPSDDVVLSSRVRLARNYQDIPFAPVMNREWAEETIRRASEAVAASNADGTFQLLRMSDLKRMSATAWWSII